MIIKAAKKAIVAILGNSDVTDEELMSAFTGAEALIISRLLTYQSANPQDDIFLTLNHLQLGGMFAPETSKEEAYHPLKRWRRVQELTRHFWKCWLQEWIPSLSPRQKWYEIRNNLKVGDVVLVLMSDSPRAHWPLARILEVYKGKMETFAQLKFKFLIRVMLDQLSNYFLWNYNRIELLVLPRLRILY